MISRLPRLRLHLLVLLLSMLLLVPTARASYKHQQARPLVSIILAGSFSGREVAKDVAALHRVLARIEAQDYDKYEVIVSATTRQRDNCAPWYEKLAERYLNHTRFACLQLKPNGPTPSVGERRNWAAIESRGDILMLWDDFQFYAPQRVSLQVESLMTANGTAHLSVLLYDYILDVSEQPAKLYRVLQKLQGGASYASLALRKEVVNGGGIQFDPRSNVVNDGEFMRRASAAGYHVRGVEMRWLYQKRTRHWPLNEFPYMHNAHSRQQLLELLTEFPRAWTTGVDIDRFVRDLLFHLAETEPQSAFVQKVPLKHGHGYR